MRIIKKGENLKPNEKIVGTTYFPKTRMFVGFLFKHWFAVLALIGMIACCVAIMNITNQALQERYNLAVISFEQAKDNLEIARENLLKVKLEIAEECLANHDSTFEEKKECKYGQNGVKEVTKRLGLEWTPRYDFPGDLFYTYLRDDDIYISQTPLQHKANDGITATDVATGGRALTAYAPDINNKEVEYVVSYDEKYLEHYGRALVLTSGLEKFVIGHITSPLEEGDVVKTGDVIGTTNLEGISTGYHVHIEYWVGVEKDGEILWKITDYKVDPSYNPHQILVEAKHLRQEGDETHLAEDSEMYKGFETPWQILSAIHLKENGRQKVQSKTSSAGAKGQMQFMPATWNGYCSELDINNLEHSITCADRYLQANLKTQGTWIKAIWRYNQANWYVADILNEAQRLGLELNKEQISFINNN